VKFFNLKNIPLTVVIGFNLFTLFIFYTAPIRWATENIPLFLFFSLSCQLLIILGYRLGFKKNIKTNISNNILFNLSGKSLNLILSFYSLTFLIKYAYLLKFNIFDIQGMVSILSVGIVNPQLGYALSLNESRPATISWSIYFLISVINQIFFIIGFIKWRDLNKWKKYLFTFFVLVDLFYWMGRGTNFGVINMISTLAFASFYKLKTMRFSFKNILRFYIVIILLLVGSIYTFSYNMVNRSGNAKLNLQAFNLGLSKVDDNAAIFNILPKELQPTYMYMVLYLTQGYYHTSLAFDLEFKPTFFLGNNPALINLADEVFNFDIWKDTYVYRLREKGVDPRVNWHSAYLWYASDFSIPGVPILLFFIGYLFGASWAISLRKNDFLSKIVFIILGNMLLYLFANNTYLSSVFYSFIFILPVWYFTRIKRYKLT
jgi:hypothetical protein